MEQERFKLQDYMPEIHLRDYLHVIMRRRWIIITFFTVLVITVLIGSLKQIPIYQAVATIRIEHSSPQVVSVQEVTTMGGSGRKDYYETQYKLIKSKNILGKVVDSLALRHSGSNEGASPEEKLASAVKVKPVRNSQLVEISVEDKDPKMAAKIANTAAQEYIAYNLKRNVDAAADAAEWLSERIEEQRQKLKNAESVLQRYRQKHNISILPLTTGSSATENIMAEYARAQSLFANYSQRYTDEHPKMIELKAQINSLKNKVQGLEDIEAGDKAMEYRVLEREVHTNKRMYEILLTRSKEIDLSGTLSVNNISIVDRAEIPQKPIKPRVKRNVLLAIVAGLMGGIGLGFFIDYLDTTIKSSEDITGILGLHFLGAIPNIREEKNELKRDKIAHYSPYSVITESYRTLRTEICQLMLWGEEVKTILMTSAEPRAGKTITISNLSISFSQKGNRVLLVDCDLRKPQMHKIFNAERNGGLSEYLTEGAHIDSIIKDTEIENLKIITAGKNLRNPAEIISSQKFEWFLGEVKSRFDFIFFDSPPVISVTDAVIIADMVDGVIQLVRSGKTLVPVAQRAKQRLANTKARKLGVILNAVEAYHGDYYEYYNRYYRYYGETGKRCETREVEV